MKIGLFYELQTPRPWDAESEQRVVREALDQIELADEIGIDYVWAVEHHFLEEYCHCSAPEVFLAAASQRTRRIRLGHGIVHTPPPINHPARVAERVAMLDQVSQGRVEFGSGEGASEIEFGAFGLDRQSKHEAWEEGFRAAVGMLAEGSYAGVEGKYVQFPRRSVVPKPYQKPHPPLWMACNRKEKIIEAASLGLGALNFSFGVKPGLSGKYVRDYWEQVEAGYEPLGVVPNFNLAIVTGFMCAAKREEALEGFREMQFFMHCLATYFRPGSEWPDAVNLRESFGDGSKVPADEYGYDRSDPGSLGIFGDPASVRRDLLAYDASGVDQVILVAQVGALPHEKIMTSLELLGREVLPEIKERDAAATAAKRERLQRLGVASGV